MSSIAATFDSVAQSYEKQLQLGISLSGETAEYFVRGRVRKFVELSQRYTQSQPAALLDFGCGVGNAVPELLDRFSGIRLTGVDCSLASLALAHRRFSALLQYRHRVKWEQHTESLAAESFDLAYSAGVFHHIAPDQRQFAFEKILHSLKRGGLFALFENNPWNPGTRWVMSRIPFDRDAICLTPTESRARLQTAGFELLDTQYLFFFPRPLAGLRLAERYLHHLPLGAQYLVLARRP